MAAPLEKLEQIALEFDVVAKPGFDAYKAEAEDKIATMKECKKELAKGVLQAEKYLEKGVFLPAKGGELHISLEWHGPSVSPQGLKL